MFVVVGDGSGGGIGGGGVGGVGDASGCDKMLTPPSAKSSAKNIPCSVTNVKAGGTGAVCTGSRQYALTVAVIY